MGKLKALPSRLRPMASRLTPVEPGDEVARNRKRDAEQPWRAWYKTARWQKLRKDVLIRDGYTCRRTGQVLGGRHPAPDSPVVNHKVPHRGDPALFWDIDNLETVSKAVHDREIQREERAGW